MEYPAVGKLVLVLVRLLQPANAGPGKLQLQVLAVKQVQRIHRPGLQCTERGRPLRNREQFVILDAQLGHQRPGDRHVAHREGDHANALSLEIGQGLDRARLRNSELPGRSAYAVVGAAQRERVAPGLAGNDQGVRVGPGGEDALLCHLGDQGRRAVEHHEFGVEALFLQETAGHHQVVHPVDQGGMSPQPDQQLACGLGLDGHRKATCKAEKDRGTAAQKDSHVRTPGISV